MSRLATLALDTSTATGSVAVGAEGVVLAEVSVSVRGGHSSALMPAVDFAMRSADIAPADLVAIVVGAGPGSFTGLRIAGATAKGMVHALGINLLAYSSLLATAAQAALSGEVVCAMFDARGRDVFAACYRFGKTLEVVVPPEAMVLDEAIARGGAGGAATFIGDGATRHAEELERATGGRVAPTHFASPRGSALLWLADRYPEAGSVADARLWEPAYLRPSGAERIAADRAAAGKANSRP